MEEQHAHWPVLDAVLDACVETGIPTAQRFNLGGVRFDARKTFLRPVSRRRNLCVLTHAQAESIVFHDKRATGLICEREGEQFHVHANREVILCSGALRSPQLLELSGVGNRRRVQELGVHPVHELDGVGENLQVHLETRMVFRVNDELRPGTPGGIWLRKLAVATRQVLSRPGSMGMTSSELGILAKSDPAQSTPNLQYRVQALWSEQLGESPAFPAIAVSVCNLRPSSRGSVHATSSDYPFPGALHPNCLSTEADRRTLVDSVRLAREIMAANALQQFEPSELRPGADLQSEAEIERAAVDLATNMFDPVARSGGRATSRARLGGVANCRCLGDALRPVEQHHRFGPDACREGRRNDPGRTRA
jgi:choline dehydrogenase